MSPGVSAKPAWTTRRLWVSGLRSGLFWEASGLDFAKGGGVCKHLLFVMLRAPFRAWCGGRRFFAFLFLFFPAQKRNPHKGTPTYKGGSGNKECDGASPSLMIYHVPAISPHVNDVQTVIISSFISISGPRFVRTPPPVCGLDQSGGLSGKLPLNT